MAYKRYTSAVECSSSQIYSQLSAHVKRNNLVAQFYIVYCFLSVIYRNCSFSLSRKFSILHPRESARHLIHPTPVLINEHALTTIVRLALLIKYVN